jgi:hypothetical protein
MENIKNLNLEGHKSIKIILKWVTERKRNSGGQKRMKVT